VPDISSGSVIEQDLRNRAVRIGVGSVGAQDACLDDRSARGIGQDRPIGKPTLAHSYAHGPVSVDLASITDPLLISGTVASALGLTTVSHDPLPSIIGIREAQQILIVWTTASTSLRPRAPREKLLAVAPSVI